MRTAEYPAREQQRLQTLERYRLLDTEPEPCFDDLTSLAAKVFDVPICLMTLVDRDRQWFKSRLGLEAAETSRDVAFCAHAILQDEPLVVRDATYDQRFHDNPLVSDEPHIRFYAGAPLRVADDVTLGTLCVIDRVPRSPEPQQLRYLETIRDAMVAQLELRFLINTTGGLNNLITMCAWCKKVRLPLNAHDDDQDVEQDEARWVSPLEALRQSRVITHGVCPACRTKMVPDE
ncbi:MAG: GAF domain-containing protein [Pseudomonadota bacterium]